MLSIKNLNISANDSLILEDISLDINNGDVVCILGQNGQGKSTLLKTIMGHFEYKIQSGSISYNDTNILDLDINQISKLGIFLANQNPVEIPGITMLDFFKSIYEEVNQKTNLLEFYKIINGILK
ncbi:MAG: ATP-binding cassette domain-containing protein, partial [Mycoplasma sp.]